MFDKNGKFRTNTGDFITASPLDAQSMTRNIDIDALMADLPLNMLPSVLKVPLKIKLMLKLSLYIIHTTYCIANQ